MTRLLTDLPVVDPNQALDTLLADTVFRSLLVTLVEAPVFDEAFAADFAAAGAIEAIAPCRMLRGVLNLSLRHALARLSQVAAALNGVRNIRLDVTA